MSDFIGLTVGLMVSQTPTRVEYSRMRDGAVKMTAINAETLSKIRSVRSRVVTANEFENRTRDPYDSTAEALWAFDMLGIKQHCV